MKKFSFLYWMVALLLPLCNVKAQDTHWNCNIYNYQYDMAVYLKLQLDGKTLTASSNYEIAAFCENECRGIASVETVPGTDKIYYYLRIRSNALQDETLTLKCYCSSTQEEIDLTETVAFTSQSVIGYPSAPFTLTNKSQPMLGDVNGDNEIDVQDVVGLIDYILGESSEGFVQADSDVNKDGETDVQDVIDLIDKILNN